MKFGCYLIYSICSLFFSHAYSQDTVKKVAYNISPHDKLIKEFIAVSKINEAAYELVSEERFNSIFESLKEQNVKLMIEELTYKIKSPSAIISINAANGKKGRYHYTKQESETRWGFHDTSIAFRFLYAERTIHPDKEGNIRLVVKRVVANQSDPPFPPGRIGRYTGSRDFSKVDNYAMKINTNDAKKLAYELTKPFSSEIEKVRAIYRWIIQNLEYQYDLPYEDYTMDVGVILKKRKTKCLGFTAVFDTLCYHAKIKSTYVYGYVNEDGSTWKGGTHVWNAVQINGKWYLIDPTWGQVDDKYFLMPPKEFIKSHFPPNRRWTLLTEPPESRKVLDF